VLSCAFHATGCLLITVRRLFSRSKYGFADERTSAGTTLRAEISSSVYPNLGTPKVAPWKVAVISTDRSIGAFANRFIIRVPIRNATCILSFELMSQPVTPSPRPELAFSGGEVISEASAPVELFKRLANFLPSTMATPNPISNPAAGINRSARGTVKERTLKFD